MITAWIMQIPEEIPAKWSEVSLIFHPSTFFFFFFFLLLSPCMTELATAKRRIDRRTIFSRSDVKDTRHYSFMITSHFYLY